jgi:hypothetical protein
VSSMVSTAQHTAASSSSAAAGAPATTVLCSVCSRLEKCVQILCEGRCFICLRCERSPPIQRLLCEIVFKRHNPDGSDQDDYQQLVNTQHVHQVLGIVDPNNNNNNNGNNNNNAINNSNSNNINNNNNNPGSSSGEDQQFYQCPVCDHALAQSMVTVIRSMQSKMAIYKPRSKPANFLADSSSIFSPSENVIALFLKRFRQQYPEVVTDNNNGGGGSTVFASNSNNLSPVTDVGQPLSGQPNNMRESTKSPAGGLLGKRSCLMLHY